ncbi:MAG: hypothetical protein QXT26_06765 [Thermoproteota archaeon]
MSLSKLPSPLKWSIRDKELTRRLITPFPEPTKVVHFAFSTPITWFKWDLATPTYPLTTSRVFGIPQSDIIGLRPLYLRISRERGLTINVEYAVLDSGGELSVAVANVERSRNIYIDKLIDPLIEAQARAPFGESLTLLEFLTGGATSLGHERIFQMVNDASKRLLFHRRIIPIRIVQLGKDLQGIRFDELEKRVELLKGILSRTGCVNIILGWPIIFSTSEKRELNVTVDMVREEINNLLLFLEELASYKGEDMRTHRQLSDIKRYSYFYVSSKVMDFQEFERAMNKNDLQMLFAKPANMDDALLLAHGFTGEVLQAIKHFEEKFKTDKIISAMRGNIQGMKALLLVPLSEDEAIESIERLKSKKAQQS